MTGILQKSSDTGVSHLSLAMPVQHLIDTYKTLVLARTPGLA
jgi:cell division protein FtsI (penicillin-binding protein 3)